MEHPIRIGLFGVGHLGKIHLRLLKSLPQFEVVGFYDINPGLSEKVAAEFGVVAYSDPEALMAGIEAASIVTPTLAHFALASRALERGLHVFIEKPITHTLEEALALDRLYQERPGCVAQVGHVERFNPAFRALDGKELAPLFIEGHRLAFYNPRGTDVSVVHDLMIHDLDIVLSMVRSPLRQVHASGVAVISETPDIANARLEFENGCVANLTASRISVKNMRRLRFFQKNAYVSVDFLEKKTEIIRLADADTPDLPESKMAWDNGEKKQFVVFEQPAIEESNAIQSELAEFAASIRAGARVRVSLHDGMQALRLANAIRDEIERHARRVKELDPNL